MTIAFRLDVSRQIGIGHFMRCLTLAIELRNISNRLVFLSRDLPNNLTELLCSENIENIELVSPKVSCKNRTGHSDMLSTSQYADATESALVLKMLNVDVLIIDHYAIDSYWEKLVKPYVKTLVVIDDLADRSHYCELLLDQNLHRNNNRYKDLVNVDCIQLLGPEFALLRKEFYKLRCLSKIRDGRVERILVSFGGIDLSNLTEKVIKAIQSLKLDLSVDIVIGYQHPAKGAISRLCEEFNYDLHIQSNKMAILMNKADLAIGSSGSTSWERCCLGLPTICITQAQNQVPIAEGLEEFGAIMNLGYGQNLLQEELSHKIVSLINQPEKLSMMSSKGMSLVDGRGAVKVANIIFEINRR